MQILPNNFRYALRQFRHGADFHGGGDPHAGARHRRHHRDLHFDSRGDAALAAGGRSLPRCIASAKATIAAWKAARKTVGNVFVSRFTSG